MSFADELRSEIGNIFRSTWSIRDGKRIPDVEDLKLSNDAVAFDAAVLYADLADSTRLVAEQPAWFAAEVYKAYLIACCRTITKNNGEITAFDGDRVMAVFIEGGKNTNAARTALEINWAVMMANEELNAIYTDDDFQIKQAVGVDSGKLFVAKTGIRGSNDLVWVGSAANFAAKLCALREDPYVSWITESVYTALLPEACISSSGEDMWTRRWWAEYQFPVYASNWWMVP